MAWRFRKSINLGGGIKLNLSKSGIGMSAGVKGFRIGANSKGVYRSMSIPGTGLYNREYITTKGRTKSNQRPSVSSGHISAPNTQNAIPSALPLPKDLASSGNGLVIFFYLLAAILLFVAWPVGLVGLAGAIVYTFKRPKNPTRNDFLLARDLARQGDKPEAIEAYKRVLEAKPNLDMVYSELAPCYEAIGDWENAADALNRSPHNPDDVSFKLDYARYLGAAKKYNECIKVIQSLPPEIKQYTAVLNLEAGAFLNIGKPELALEVLQQGPMRKRNVDDTILLYFYLLGVTYNTLDDKKKAVQYLNKVAAHDMNYENIQELLGELQVGEKVVKPELNA